MGNSMGNCNSNSTYSASAPGAVAEKTANVHSKIHEGSILGICSYTDSDEDLSAGKHCILTCSDDKRVAKFAYNKESKTLAESVTYSTLHSKTVNKVVASKSFLWSVSRDLTACQYDKNMNVVNHYHQDIHTLNISSICVRKDESFMYTGSRDYNIKAFDVETKTCTQTFSQPRNVITCMQLHPIDNHMLYQGSEDLQIRIWDTRESSGKHPASTIPGYVYFPLCMSMHKSGDLVATGCKGFNSVGCEIKVWDVRSTSKPVAELKSHSQDVTDCKFSDDGDYLLSCSKDGTICAWDKSQFTGSSSGHGQDSSGNNAATPACKYSQNNKMFTSLSIFGDAGHSRSSSNSSNKALSHFVTSAFDGSLSFYSLNNNSNTSGKLDVAEVAYTSPHFMPEVDVEE